MNTIKNIIFDLVGVLVGLDKQRCVEAFWAIGGRNIAFYVDEQRTEDLFYDTEVGRMGEEAFCDEVRRLTASTADNDQIVWAWNQLLTTIDDQKKVRLLDLSTRYRLFLLSNTNEMHWRFCRDKLFPYNGKGAEDYFEGIFLSYEMHLIKPSKEIFQQVLDEALLVPEETLLIDDTAANCESASKLGIQTLHETTGRDWLKVVK